MDAKNISLVVKCLSRTGLLVVDRYNVKYMVLQVRNRNYLFFNIWAISDISIVEFIIPVSVVVRITYLHHYKLQYYIWYYNIKTFYNYLEQD